MPSATLTDSSAPSNEPSDKVIRNSELGIYPIEDDQLPGSDVAETPDFASDAHKANLDHSTLQERRLTWSRLFAWRRQGSFSPTVPQVQIVIPPLHLLVRIGSLLLNPNAYGRNIGPFIEDIRREYYQAVKARRFKYARWILLRGYLTIAWPLFVAIYRTMRTLLR